MADGSISMADGLGLKALDSNEVWRKQHLPDSEKAYLVNPNSPIMIELQTPHNSSTSADPVSTSIGFGFHSPKSTKNTSPSRKLQQVFMEESRKIEAEERASHSDEVQNFNPNSTILINDRGIPYVDGDPNMGYPAADIKPTYTPSQFVPVPGAVPSKPGQASSHFTSTLVAESSSYDVGLDSNHQSHKTPLNECYAQPHLAPNPRHHSNSHTYTKPPHTHQPNPKPNAGQIRPKPRNWAALLQSQSPSMDMKLDYFPDLQKGKEAQVEIDVELTEVGKWNRYLIGHFLDGKMDYPLLVSTARNQWKDLFVAVKPDISGFYLFEFKDEQANMQVLEGGPYFFSQKYLVLEEWHRMMKPLQEQPTKIPVWVKFHDLPLELWNQGCLSRVASTVGRPIHVDQATARTSKQPGLLQTKTTKARVCIEISAEQDLPDEVAVTVQGETVVVPIEYQVLPPMCSHCHVIGHSLSKCVKHSITPSPVLPVAEDMEWQLVNHGKQKMGELSLSSPQKIVQCPQASPISQQVQQEDSDDSEADLLEVLERVVSSEVKDSINSQKVTTPSSIANNPTVSAPPKQSRKVANKDSKATVSVNKISQHIHKPDGDEKERPDLIYHSDVQLLLGGSSKAGHNGNLRSHSKGFHKKRK